MISLRHRQVSVHRACDRTHPTRLGQGVSRGGSGPEIAKDELLALRKEKFGVLFQDGALSGSMRGLDNVAFPLRQNTDKSDEEILKISRRRLTGRARRRVLW